MSVHYGAQDEWQRVRAAPQRRFPAVVCHSVVPTGQNAPAFAGLMLLLCRTVLLLRVKLDWRAAVWCLSHVDVRRRAKCLGTQLLAPGVKKAPTTVLCIVGL
jgi:hypothetical protein